MFYLLPALLDEIGFNFMRKGIAAIEGRGEYALNVLFVHADLSTAAF